MIRKRWGGRLETSVGFGTNDACDSARSARVRSCSATNPDLIISRSACLNRTGASAP